MYLNGKDELVNNDLNLIILVNNSKFKIEFNSFYFFVSKIRSKKSKNMDFCIFRILSSHKTILGSQYIKILTVFI
jgi:hypothetical protein